MYNTSDEEILNLLKRDLEQINSRLKELKNETKKLNYYKKTKQETFRQIDARQKRNAIVEQKKQNLIQGNTEESQTP